MKIRLWLASGLTSLVCLASPARGQSLFSASGLGIPTESLDARSRALGSVGVGLWGTGLLPTDPAASVGLVAMTGMMTAQPSWVDFTRADGSESGNFRGARFPLFGFAYPARGYGVFTVSVGSVLDQRFSATREVTVPLSSGTGGATDTFTQDGGVATLNVGFARPLGATSAYGVTFGRYGGSVTRRLVRTLGDVNAFGAATTFESVGRWTYSGNAVTAGMSTTVRRMARIAGSATWSGTLHADADATTAGASSTFTIPLQLRVGASALLAPGLLVTGGVARADWSVTAADVAAGVEAGAVTTLGVGVELSRARLFGRTAPLRLGYRSGDLPFGSGSGAPSESVMTGGLGLTLNQQAGLILGAVDFAVEHGERKDGSLSERFWRAVVSLRVSGI